MGFCQWTRVQQVLFIACLVPGEALPMELVEATVAEVGVPLAGKLAMCTRL